MSAWPVWADGRLLSGGAPALAAEDLGLQQGLAVFETILLEQRCLYFLEDHLERLERGARELCIAWPPPHDPEHALRELARALEGRDAALRPMLTRGMPGRGAMLVVTARAIVPAPPEGVVVVVSRQRASAEDLLQAVKSTSRVRYALAREQAAARGGWDALIPTHEGDLAEGTISNLWAFTGGRLVTPATTRGCLAGVTRARLLADLRRDPPPFAVEEGRLEPSDLARAEEVFLSNATGRVLPVRSVLTLAASLPGAAGAVARQMRQRIARLEAAERARFAAAGGLLQGQGPRAGRAGG